MDTTESVGIHFHKGVVRFTPVSEPSTDWARIRVMATGCYPSVKLAAQIPEHERSPEIVPSSWGGALAPAKFGMVGSNSSTRFLTIASASIFLMLCVISLQFLQSLGLVHVHHPKLLLPTMEPHLRDVLLPADLNDRFLTPGCLPRHSDLVFSSVFLPFHSLAFLCAQTNSFPDPKKRGHVRRDKHRVRRTVVPEGRFFPLKKSWRVMNRGSGITAWSIFWPMQESCS